MLLLISLLLFTFELCVIWKKRFEEIIPCVASAAVLCCYFLSMFQALQWFAGIVAVLALGGLGRCIVEVAQGKGKMLCRNFLNNVLTPGFFCFLFISGFFIVAAAPHRVSHTDEVYVWSLQPLSIFFRNGLSGNYTHLSPRFATYTPGVHLFQWIGLFIHGEWEEQIVFLWLWLLYAVLLLPITRNLTWKKAGWMPVFIAGILILPGVFDCEAYLNLRVDVALGLCLGCACIQAWRFANEDGNDRLFYGVTLSLVLALLVLIKQPGIGWALFPPIIFLIANSQKRPIRQSLKEAALTFALPLATFLSWYFFCQIAGLRGQHIKHLESNTQQIFQGQLAVSVHDLLALCQALGTSLLYGFSQIGTDAFLLPQVICLAVFLVFPIVLYKAGKMSRKTMRRMNFLLSAGYILYIVVFYIGLLTVFRPEWVSPVNQTEIASLVNNVHRYGAPLWYGLLMLFSFIGLSPENSGESLEVPAIHRHTLRFSRVLACFLAITFLFSARWDIWIHNLIPGKYTPNHLSEAMDDIFMNSIWRDNIEEPDAIVMLASDSYPYNRDWLQYALAPIKLVMPYETIQTPEDFQNILRGYRVQYFVSEGTENDLYQLALQCNEDAYLDAYTVYVVEWNGDDAQLIDLYEWEESDAS